MWLPVEAPDGYVAELAKEKYNEVWKLWTKRENDEFWVYVDEFKSTPVGLEVMVGVAERALLDPVYGAQPLCYRVAGWKERDWEWVHPEADED